MACLSSLCTPLKFSISIKSDCSFFFLIIILVSSVRTLTLTLEDFLYNLVKVLSLHILSHRGILSLFLYKMRFRSRSFFIFFLLSFCFCLWMSVHTRTSCWKMLSFLQHTAFVLLWKVRWLCTGFFSWFPVLFPRCLCVPLAIIS